MLVRSSVHQLCLCSHDKWYLVPSRLHSLKAFIGLRADGASISQAKTWCAVLPWLARQTSPCTSTDRSAVQPPSLTSYGNGMRSSRASCAFFSCNFSVSAAT